MSEEADQVRTHYEMRHDDTDLVAIVSQMLDGAGGSVTASLLAGMDHFHVGGLAATAALAQRAGIECHMAVLDAGSGLGGPSRYLAETYGCRVTGGDLAPAFVAVARLLAERTGLDRLVTYDVGTLLNLAYADDSFVFYDVVAADGAPPPFFPVPWAASPATSFLLTPAETLLCLERAGLIAGALTDVTAEALGWIGQARPPSPLSLSTVLGPRFAEMSTNLGRSLRDGRVRLVMGGCAAP